MVWTVSRVPAEATGAVIDRLAPKLARALANAGDVDSIARARARARAGEAALWVVHDGDDIAAAVLFDVRRRGVRPVVWILALAGRDMNAWVDELEALLDDYRQLVGAEALAASCRPGLARRLKARGWRTRTVIMEKR